MKHLSFQKPSKWKTIKIFASICALCITLLVAAIAVNNWFNYHFIVFKSPIIFQQPVTVKNRKAGYISPLSLNTTAYAKASTMSAEPIYTPRTEIIAAVNKEWGVEQIEYAENIIKNESGFEPCKINGGAVDCNYAGNRAAGMPQALPFTKMGCALSDAKCQAKWFVSYVKSRYGNPQKCWDFWQQNKWY